MNETTDRNSQAAKAHFSLGCQTCSGQGRCILSGLEDLAGKPVQLIPSRFNSGSGERIPSKINNHSGLHIIRSGFAMVSVQRKQEKAVGIAGPGDVVGLCSNIHPDLTATALTDLNSCFIHMQDFDGLLSKSPQFSRNVISYMCNQNWKSSHRIAGLAHHSVKMRVKALLCELAREYGLPSEYGVKIALKISRSRLAELCGAVTETLARVLTELEKEKFIVRVKWDIHLVTPTPNA